MSQRQTVRASLLADVQRETHHDVYAARKPRVARALSNGITARNVSEQIRDLGDLLTRADSPDRREWLILRLRNRLDLLEVVDGRGGAL